MNESQLASRLAAHRLLPVIVLDSAADARPLGEALLAGGLPVAEVTFRTEAAEAAVAAMAGLPGLSVGAGTVRSVETAKRAIGAGARFIVSPGLKPEVVEYCRGAGVAVLPGVVTPTEIEVATGLGLRTLKFFPADVFGGVRAIRSLSSVYAEVKFVPTGGISPANLPEYLAERSVLACGGSWMVPRGMVSAGRFDEIGRLAAEAVKLAATVRPHG
jgi:2-dehydro-3-deoxyphosphogluconate aldolase/(4S)-4-hydroxy-2-oxoglutarate aldolase